MFLLYLTKFSLEVSYICLAAWAAEDGAVDSM
jgi:hypothetical protein